MQTAVAVASSHWSDLSARRGSTSPQCLHILYTIIHFVALTLSYKGQRQLKVLDFSVEWYNLEHIPLIHLHSLTNRSPPLISLFCQSVPKCRLPKNPASPRGKPRTQKPLVITIQRASQLRGFRVAKLAAPTGCSGNHWLATTNRVHSLSQPVRADSSLREGAKAALPQREAKPPLL